jgi:methylated-DNA-[protein]-cysteine S-methyltransferase
VAYDTEETLAELSSQISPRVLEAPGRLDEVRRQLDLYFDGRLHEFDLPLDWQLSKGFRRRALRAIDRIPYGRTRSYTQIARSAGNERAVRAAGTACGANRSRSSSPATASCAAAAPSAATAGVCR